MSGESSDSTDQKDNSFQKKALFLEVSVSFHSDISVLQYHFSQKQSFYTKSPHFEVSWVTWLISQLVNSKHMVTTCECCPPAQKLPCHELWHSLNHCGIWLWLTFSNQIMIVVFQPAHLAQGSFSLSILLFEKYFGNLSCGHGTVTSKSHPIWTFKDNFLCNNPLESFCLFFNLILSIW